MKTIFHLILEYPDGCSFALAAVAIIFLLFYARRRLKRERMESRIDTRSRINQVIIPPIIRLRCDDPLSDIVYIEKAIAYGEIAEHELKLPMATLLSSAIERAKFRIFILKLRLKRHQNFSPRDERFIRQIMSDLDRAQKDLNVLVLKRNKRLAVL